MRVVLDTNVLLVSIPKLSKYRPINVLETIDFPEIPLINGEKFLEILKEF
jgi:hypothetical protein